MILGSFFGTVGLIFLGYPYRRYLPATALVGCDLGVFVGTRKDTCAGAGTVAVLVLVARLRLARALRGRDLHGLVVGAERVCAACACSGTVAVLTSRALRRRRSAIAVGATGIWERLGGTSSSCIHVAQEAKCDDDDG